MPTKITTNTKTAMLSTLQRCVQILQCIVVHLMMQFLDALASLELVMIVGYTIFREIYNCRL